MIVSGGENVYPIEVEKTLAAHPDVAEAAVLGVDDEQYGQRLVAFVVLTDGVGATAGRPQAARPGEPGELQGAAQHHGARRVCRAAAPARSFVVNSTHFSRRTAMRRRRSPLLRARRRTARTPPTPCSRWAARATSRSRCSSSAGRRARRRRWWPAASMLDAVRRGLRGDFAGRAAESRWRLTAIAWGLLGFVYRRNAQSQAVLRGRRCGRPSATTTRPSPREERRRRRGGVLRTSWSRRRYVKKTDVVRYGPHRANVADIWRRARPAARRQSARAAAGSRRRLGDRHAPSAGLPADEPPGRTRLDLRLDGLPGQPAQHLARPHRRRQAGAGVGQGEHRRVRRRPRLRGDHRRLGGRAPDARWPR